MNSINKNKLAKVTNSRYRLHFHIMPPSGWMNDPNGLSYFKGYYHLFYQYYPYKAVHGPMHWGHYISKNLIHWKSLPIALIPDDKEDSGGCFSGSAITRNHMLFLMYTGNNFYNKENPNKYWQNQNIASSKDGIHFTKFQNNPVIAKPPKDNTQEFRDPKVWERNGRYYIVLGSQNKDKVGRALMYRSADLLHWKYMGPIAKSKSADTEGSMWECPDIFPLGGKDILLCSPQGIKATDKKYLNLDETGYFIGHLDYENHHFSHGKFTELDHGHDFYATQTIKTKDGRRLVFGWMAMWGHELPEQKDGWAGALTLPRVLTLKNDHIFMNPAREVKDLRKKKTMNRTININDSQMLHIQDPKHVELDLTSVTPNWQGNRFTFAIQSNNDNIISLTFNKANHELVLYRRGKDPYRYSTVSPSKNLKMQIFIDTSSVESFVNNGEAVFTDRYYVDGTTNLSVSADKPLKLHVTAYHEKNVNNN